MRTKKALLNIATSLAMQLVAVVCGFVVPVALIRAFGSESYGAIGSITQFLGFVVLLEGGVGGVTRAALYKPLADLDICKVSGIVRATESFFRKIGIVFVLYSLLIAVFFPYITQYSGEWAISFSLTVVIGISTLVQYLFGMAYSILLQADQRSYINNGLQIFSYIANACVVVVMVGFEFDIVVVQACSSAVYALRPLVLFVYARRRYGIQKVEPDNGSIKDRWNGLGHHLAFFFRSNIAMVSLSIFAPLSEVAVYSVYNLVANGLQKLVSAFSSGIEAAFGNMIANDERELLSTNFRIYELASSIMVAVAFSTAMAVILPFVSVYTSGVSDANYYRPAFALLIVCSTALYCFRLPYNTIVLAAGHYRETRNGAFLEAILAVSLSFILVPLFGINGAATALLIATLVRTVQYGLYASKAVLFRSGVEFFFRAIFTALIIVAVGGGGYYVAAQLPVEDYFGWFVLSFVCLLCAVAVTALASILCYRNDLKGLWKKLRQTIGKKS